MSSITASVSELNNIHSELKRLRIQTRTLNSRKKIIEKEIADFLESRDQPGIKYQGIAIIAEEKEKHKMKGKKQREEDVKNYLRGLGVDDEAEAYKGLLHSMRGSPEHAVKLKIQRLKNQ
jgi:hypothetical protein